MKYKMKILRLVLPYSITWLKKPFDDNPSKSQIKVRISTVHVLLPHVVKFLASKNQEFYIHSLRPGEPRVSECQNW